MSRLDRRIAVLAAVLVAGLGLLPIANWIPAGYAIPGWPELFDGWWSGTALVAGLAVVLAIVSRRVPILASPAPWRALSAAWDRHPALATALLALVAGAAYLWAALSVFSGRPLLIDELVQVYQARTFADGALTRAAGPHPEFFSSNLILERGGRFFAQFPAGGPAMLALGSLVGAEWLVGPLFGVLSAMLFAMLARRLEPRPGVAMAAACLFALAPFVVFMSGSHMNHVTLLTWLLVAWTGLARLTGPDPDRVRAGLLTGLGFGVAATIRPMDAVAFAVPAGAWLLVRSVRRRSLLPLLAAGAGVALPVAIQLWINAQTTGAPLLFAYNANWGANMSLGFHETPWGEQHTPARGLELLNLYFLRLETYFLELPIPSLLPAVAALALSRRLAAFDRYLLTSAALLAGLYFTYWHDGFYLGPRFLYPLLPMLAVWTARALPLLRERVAEDGLLSRSLGFAAFVAVVLGLATSVPLRAREYRNGMLTMRWNPDAAAGAAGVRNALVLVRESWGAALVARMWAAGVTPSDAERIYRKADACALEFALDAVEERALRGDSAVAVLRPLTRDSSRLVRSPYTTDPSNRLLPGSVYTEECLARLAEDQRGFTLFPPLLLSRREDLVYARDLGARDSLLLDAHRGRAVYLLRPPSQAVGAAPRFELLPRDSLLSAWRAGR